MTNEVYMDIPSVNGMSRMFRNIGTTLRSVNKELAECMEILNETAYTGRVGGTAVKRYIESLQPVIVELSQKSYEISHDLQISINAFEEGDDEGATRFH